MSNPLDNTGLSYRIAYQNHALELESAQDRRDNDSYVRNYHGTIQVVHWDGDDEGRAQKAGYISYSVVKVALLDNDGADLFDVFDSEGWLLEIGECLFDWETRQLKEEIAEVIDQPLRDNLLIIHDLHLLPAFRGRRLGLAIAKCLLEEHADACGFAFLNIYPAQCDKTLDERRRKALRLEAFARDKARAMERLTQYFGRINLRTVPGTSYLAYHLDQVVPECGE